MKLANYEWQRDPVNPVLPPDPNSTCESTRCMNPFVLSIDGEYRLYYTGHDGTDLGLQSFPGIGLAVSEDCAVAAPFVWRDGKLYQMLYSGIRTRCGYYSISEAVSEDGYTWYRGKDDKNLSLAPESTSSWESQMVEYPCRGDTSRRRPG